LIKATISTLDKSCIALRSCEVKFVLIEWNIVNARSSKHIKRHRPTIHLFLSFIHWSTAYASYHLFSFIHFSPTA
jgi:hypothetical protein